MNKHGCIKDCEGGVELRIYCQPRANKTEIAGEHGDTLKVRLAVLPVEGRANRELIKFLAKFFGITQRQLRILSGLTGRRKLVLLSGLKAQDIEDRLKS